MNPFLILDLPLDTDAAEVRAAYQKLLRRYPPETMPEKFQLIQGAYETLRTERDRWQWRLFHDKDEASGPLEALRSFSRLPDRMKPPGAKPFRTFLQACGEAAATAHADGRKKKARKNKRRRR